MMRLRARVYFPGEKAQMVEKWGSVAPEKQFCGEEVKNKKIKKRRVGKHTLFIILQNIVDEAGKSL